MGSAEVMKRSQHRHRERRRHRRARVGSMLHLHGAHARPWRQMSLACIPKKQVVVMQQRTVWLGPEGVQTVEMAHRSDPGKW